MKEVPREQVTDKEIQMLIDSHENGTAMFLRVDAYYLMAKELQERRKAAMDGEPVSDGEQLAIGNFRSAMEGIGHIRRTLEETFGGLHGTHVEPDVFVECKAICDAIYAAYCHAQQPVVAEWTNEECLEFLSIAFRHAEIKGDLEMDDIRLGIKMVNACRATMLDQK